MKKSYYFLFLVFLSLSCTSDDDKQVENHTFLNQITGIYLLEEMHSDIPLDLNLDGILKTNLLDEIDCYSNYPPELFRSDVIYKPANGGYWSLTYQVAEHTRFLNDIPDDQCFRNVGLSYEYTVNEKTKEIQITWRDEERETEYGTLKDVKWIDNKIHYYVEKRYYSSDGWTTAIIHLIYKKYSEEE